MNSLGTFCFANVYCDMSTDSGGWIVIQRNRLNSSLNFNKNWKEYEDGFGDPNEDFWAGLKLTVLLKGNIANARNFFGIYERVSSVTSAF